MIIEINKDIDKYKETIVLGLTLRQLIFSVLSILAGGSIVLLLYKHIGLTMSAYIAVPVVAPIALTGFYSYNGMTFMQLMKKKIYFAFFNRPLLYVSSEGEPEIDALKREQLFKEKQIAKKKKRRRNNVYEKHL